jgi:hypothetical protein
MNREEDEIRRLFQALKREDESRTPPFDTDWSPALSRMEYGRTARRTFRLYAATAIALVLLGCLTLIIFRLASRQSAPSAFKDSVVPTQTPTPAVASDETPSNRVGGLIAEQKQKAKTDSKAVWARVRSRNTGRRLLLPQASVALISRWRSPTEFLLNSPGGQLLKTVPRPDESLLEIKAVAPDANK